MSDRFNFSRRQVLAGLAYGAAAGVLSARGALGQTTDLKGFDPLWRNAEEAIHAFFGDVSYLGEGVEMDLPQHADVGSSVPLTIRVPCAMTEEEFPRVLHVLAHGNPTPHVLSAFFTPASGRAEFSTRIRLETSQKVTTICQMSDGRHIRIDKEVSVSFGACAQIGTGTNDDVYDFKPQTRVNVPPTATRGSIIPIRALISHPQETGMRLDGMEEWVRKRIISSFGCLYNGASVFRARLHPAIATNPYFQFHARAEQSGAFEFSWYDTQNLTFANRATITVT
jgi:predicted secreted protein